MILRHATLRKFLPGIERQGLLCAKSLGKLKVVWLHAPGKSAWALLHTVRRHGGRIEDVVVLEIDVPRGWLRKSRRRLWYSVRDIPFGRMVRLIDFASAAEPCAA
jgi:hypothetical protein